ncbi:MAG: N-acetylmuramoyl-L-alanine amidase [Opitutaceae bacterium]
MPFREESCLSPNWSPQPAHECLGVLFHHSVMGFEETIAFMQRVESQVSYHCLIAPDGTRCTLVPDHHLAWHAGASHFLGRTRCNDFLLGLAFAGDTYRSPLTPSQVASALEWLAPRWRRHAWTLERMTDHRQVAPLRKNDLNPVEWERLRATLQAFFDPK